MFESQDDDYLTRILSPVNVRSLNLTSRNVLNSMMDHLWDGFYTSMKRRSRYPALVQGGKDMYYEIIYSSTPPLRQRFAIRSNTTSIIVRMRYPKAGVYKVRGPFGKEVRANDWDKKISGPATIQGAYCGENRYVGVENILEFYLPPQCNLTIEPVDSIQTTVRLNWTLSEFYSSGGTTKFVDRVAASLGIKVANVKIVSVYMGSVIV